ncbi:hypothetical protein LOY92_006168 [Ophidiomyces ophidiicola]|nr:hypothetical protein LOY92_006168 [Ophidiomyces ophidiicola]
MISDSDLYKLAIFLGSCAMLLIVLYHFLEVNSKDSAAGSDTATPASKPTPVKGPDALNPSSATAKTTI